MSIQEQFERLKELVKKDVIRLDDFYVVDLDNGRISLQGYVSAYKLRKYGELVEITFDEECGWFKGAKNGIRITLTIE